MLLCFGHEEETASHTYAVALILSKEPRTVTIGWDSHGYTFVKASFKTMKEETEMNAIQCYAPTSDSNKDV
ncbi:unnamed protein product [Schistosoma margrebowiei]|uniref:Uncharacterized protein n=1 Tax=Schistosoma margrebowiei TaxID=48269 RepID=A0A183MXR4_9TREM|nr:unnamed protein product [Schistosoma margrebowiei]